jgi:hypothetical protein
VIVPADLSKHVRSPRFRSWAVAVQFVGLPVGGAIADTGDGMIRPSSTSASAANRARMRMGPPSVRWMARGPLRADMGEPQLRAEGEGETPTLLGK